MTDCPEPWKSDKYGLGYERDWEGGTLWAAYESEDNPRHWHWERMSQDGSVISEGNLDPILYNQWDLEEAFAAVELYEGKL